MSAITKIEDLRFWFDNQKHVHWTLYRGFLNRKLSTFILASNENITDREASFSHLEKMIKINTNGKSRFTILTKPDPGSNTGMTVHFESGNETKSTSINGMSNQSAIPMINGLTIQQHEQMIRADERSKVEMEHRIEGLESALHAQQNDSFVDKIGNMISENPSGAKELLLGFRELIFGSNTTPVAANIGTQGFEEESKIPNQNQEVVFQYDTDRLTKSLEMIRSVFPDIHEFLEESASFFTSNPAQAKLMRIQLQKELKKN